MVAVSNVYAMNYSKASDPLCVLRQLINNDDACEIKTLLQSYNLNSHDPLIPEVALYFSVMFKNVGFAKALSGAGTYVGKRRGVVTQSPLLLVFDTFDNKKAQSLYLPFFIDSIEMNLKKEFFGDSKSGEKISSNLLKSVHVGSLQSDNYYCSLWSRLMYSAYYGYCDVILFFINHQEYFPTNVLGIDEWWDTVARLAVYNEDKRLIDALVDADMIKLSGVLHQSKMLLNFLGCPIC
jgi:hypothetical protein